MKRLAAALAAFCFLLPFAVRAAAQETGGGAVYGFTSLDYDAQTNQFTAYSETDPGGIDCPYYNTNVNAFLLDPNGTQVASQLGQNSPCTTASVSFNYTPQISGNYTLYGQHYLTLDQAYNCDEDGFEQNCWADYDDFIYWSDFEGVDYPWGYEFDEGPDGFTASPYQVETLGETYDVVSDTVELPCGDVRDTMIAEYWNHGVPWIPTCADFTETSPDPAWPFAELNSGDYPQWAIIQVNLTGGLDWMKGHVSTWNKTISSGYRNPNHEYSVCVNHNPPLVYHPDSRHQMGDAADIATNGDGTLWGYLKAAAKGDSSDVACVEPWQESTYDHIHIDYRVADSKIIFPVSSCPRSAKYQVSW